MSKGSNRRPQQVSRAEMDRRWAETFGGFVFARDYEVVQARVRTHPMSFKIEGSAPQADGDDGSWAGSL